MQTNASDARRMQEVLRAQVVVADDFGAVNTVAGVDAGPVDNKTMRGAVAVLSLPQLQLVDSAVAVRAVEFPYVPGLLSFRELPVLLDALAKLRVRPDLILCDGQGIAHPRRFGIACHLGLSVNTVTIGVAKSRLIGDFQEPGNKKGASAPLMHKGEHIGDVLRTRDGKKPLFISPGHRISHESALRFTLACCTKYRLPETTRAAHRLASGGK